MHAITSSHLVRKDGRSKSIKPILMTDYVVLRRSIEHASKNAPIHTFIL